ncbi:HAD-IIIC family phosphatase [Candidatus Woesearchaeota archaeon]|nr:HAD-IIIC family phosphatase [Candidatus Woesearchaeota archaeon]
MDKLEIMNGKYKSLLMADKIKAVITDLDNTLWSGILAEKQKLVLNEQYYEFLKTIYSKGIQIIIVSKNDESDVLNAFNKLKIDKNIFTLIVSNWDPKYLNIDKIIQQMNFRPETIIFIDDNPFERNEVKSKIPKINCLDIQDWNLLMGLPYIKNKQVENKSEIKERVNRYITSFKANELRKNFKEDIEFLKSLKRELSIGLISPDNLDRFTRLFVVTHRLNFNPGKLEDYDIALDYLYNKINSGYKLYAISTRENDVSLGLTGAFVVKIEGDKAIIENGTFSCGIIGRDFEQKALIALIDLLKKDKIRKLDIFVTLTSTNKRVKEILEELGFKDTISNENQMIYNISLDNFKPKKYYEWIKILSMPPEMDYFGIPSVINFFNKIVKPLIKKKSNIINLGSARGEVLGHLQKDAKDEFYKFIKNYNIQYTKLDLDSYPEEDNLVGNAENMKSIIKEESQDLVIAIELLEHTESYWNVINEMIRVCKVGGYIFVTVPSYNYPKHEYPIDKWRIGPKTLSNFFPSTHFKVINLELEGNVKAPRRCMILVQKLNVFSPNYGIPKNGKTDWRTGLTLFD